MRFISDGSGPLQIYSYSPRLGLTRHQQGPLFQNPKTRLSDCPGSYRRYCFRCLPRSFQLAIEFFSFEFDKES